MNEPLENLYFNWLCAKVIPISSPPPRPSYMNLLRILHNTEFVWLMSGDDNRAEDGKELRAEFLIEADIPDDLAWRSVDCSLLEMFIAFSRRAEFISEYSAREWFWIFLNNLELTEFHDESNSVELIQDRLHRFIWRTYDWSGAGGLFPMTHSKTDQRDVEIWYQFNFYLEDQNLVP